MPFWKKAYQKMQGVYYPQAVVQGKQAQDSGSIGECGNEQSNNPLG